MGLIRKWCIFKETILYIESTPKQSLGNLYNNYLIKDKLFSIKLYPWRHLAALLELLFSVSQTN